MVRCILVEWMIKRENMEPGLTSLKNKYLREITIEMWKLKAANEILMVYMKVDS